MFHYVHQTYHVLQAQHIYKTRLHFKYLQHFESCKELAKAKVKDVIIRRIFFRKIL